MIYTLDFVTLRYTDGHKIEVLLLKRDKEPFKNQYALPGGWVFEDTDETLDEAFLRIADQKVRYPMSHFEQVETVGSSKRDPRGWSTTTVYLTFMEDPYADIHDDMMWASVYAFQGQSLPFDHTDLLDLAVNRLVSKSQYSTLPIFLTSDFFTLSFMERVYETLLGGPVNTSAFRKRIEKTSFLVPTEDFERVSGRRPARYFHRVQMAEPEFYERLMSAVG